MPVSELRQTVRNLSSGATNLHDLIGGSSYAKDIVKIHDQLCDVLDYLNQQLVELEGEGEPPEWERFDSVA